MNDAVSTFAVFAWIIGIVIYLATLVVCWERVVGEVYYAKASLTEKVVFWYFWGTISVVALLFVWWLSGGIAMFINDAIL
jgi:hypothetical protein